MRREFTSLFCGLDLSLTVVLRERCFVQAVNLCKRCSVHADLLCKTLFGARDPYKRGFVQALCASVVLCKDRFSSALRTLFRSTCMRSCRHDLADLVV